MEKLPSFAHGKPITDQGRLGNVGQNTGYSSVPSGAIHDEHGMCTLFDMAADLIDMELHGLGVGKGQSQRSADTAGRADAPNR